MLEFKNEIIETELGPVEYSTVGEGQAVLFVHGGHSNSKERMFQKGWDLSKYQLITPSRPGYSATPLAGNTSPESQARVLAALLEALDIPKVIVVGISAGGLTAIAFASDFAERTEKLILISAVTQKWLSPDDDLYIRGMRMFASEKEKRNWKFFRIAFRLFPRQMCKVMFKELSTMKGAKITRDEISDIKAMTSVQSSGSGFVTDLTQNPNDELLPKIKAPTLILHSENDHTVTKRMAFFADEKIPNSILKTYNNKWGHLLWTGADSAEPIRDLNDFLEKT